MRALVKIVGGLAVLAVLGVIVAVVILKSIDVNQYKGVIADEVARATGRNLEISGDLILNISLSPSVSVEGVRFANAPWGSSPDMMTIKRFEAEVDLMPLFSGTIDVKRIVLLAPEILLETDADGRGNWALSSAVSDTDAAPSSSDGGNVILPAVHKVLIKDAKLTFIDGQTKVRTALKLDSLEASAGALDAPLVFALIGAYNSHPFSAKGQIGSVAQILDGGVLPISVTAKAGGASLIVGGEIKRPQEGKGLDFAITVNGENLADVAAIAGVQINKSGPYDLSMRLRDSKDGYRLDGLKVKVGRSDVVGNLAVALSGVRPRITTNLGSTRLDLGDFMPPQGDPAPPAQPPKTSNARVFSADPIALDGLKAVDVTVSYVAKEFLADKVRLTELDVKLTLNDGLLSVKPLSGVFANGRIKVTAVVDGRGKTGKFSMRAKVDGLQVGTVLREMGQKVYLENAMNLALDVTGSGNSVRAIMAGLNGKTSLVGRGGKINSQALKTATAGIMTALPWIKKQDNNINCVVSRFDIRNGMATSKVLLFDTSGMSVVGGGKINLRDETIQMQVNADAKSASLASLAVPVTIGGTLASPSFLPDPVAVAKGAASMVLGVAGSSKSLLGSVLGTVTGSDTEKTSEPAPAKDDPCVAAIQGRQAVSKAPVSKTPPAKTQTAPKPVQKEEGGLGGLLKGLGGTLDKVLGAD